MFFVGFAPNRGQLTSLQDIEIAVHTELPLVKQHLSYILWAVRGNGAQGQRINRITGERFPLSLRPSAAIDLNHGFCSVTVLMLRFLKCRGNATDTFVEAKTFEFADLEALYEPPKK